MTHWSDFRRVVFVDFEFQAPDGHPPQPICVVARQWGEDQSRKVWLDGEALGGPPYPVAPDTLFVAYFASAELGCHLALDWPFPAQVLDLYAEFRVATNGLNPPSGSGLLGALAYYGVPSLGVHEKDEMRSLALRGGPWSSSEREALLDYCESDVLALEELLGRMKAQIDLPRALLRGRYMKAVARMEAVGVPFDTHTLALLEQHWASLKLHIIGELDAESRIYDGTRFVTRAFIEWINAHQLPWPLSPTGQPLLDRTTFEQMSRRYPQVKPIAEVRRFLSRIKPPAFTVGADGRNRAMLSPYRSKTGRNQPSNARFIFGAPAWARGLIQPKPGYGLAYIDWSQQEFAIAAALSEDPAMIEAYQSGDPYLALAKQTGGAPPDATKASHPRIREQFKLCVLGVQYGMGPESLAAQLGQSPCHARALLALHRAAYPRYWRWAQAAADSAVLTGGIQAVFGWRLQVTSATKPRTLLNFPMQANGAEMLRLACIYATEAGVRVCAPVHDALLVEAPLPELDAAVALTRACMAQASGVVLAGLVVRTDVQRVESPGRLLDGRGEAMWRRVVEFLESQECRV